MMKTSHVNEMDDVNVRIGERLRAERERLGKSQAEFSALLGTSGRTQGEYERGKTSPTAAYLAGLSQLGADIHFIVLGERSPSSLPDDAKLLLSKYLSMPEEARGMVLAMLSGYAPKEPQTRIKIAGNVSQVIEGGTVDQSNAVFSINSDPDRRKPSKK